MVIEIIIMITRWEEVYRKSECLDVLELLEQVGVGHVQVLQGIEEIIIFKFHSSHQLEGKSITHMSLTPTLHKQDIHTHDPSASGSKEDNTQKHTQTQTSPF